MVISLSGEIRKVRKVREYAEELGLKIERYSEGGERDYRDSQMAIDSSIREVRVNGRRVHLSLREHQLLNALVSRNGTGGTHAQLMEEAWKTDNFSPSYLRGYIRQLRKRIEEDPNNPKLIITVYGIGYMYNSPH